MPPKVRTQRKVALLVETSRSYGRDLLRGIALFARTRSNWALLHQEMTIDARPPGWMMEMPIDGVIARVDTRTIEPLRALRVPCVDVRCSRRYIGIPQVETDDRKVSELAFQHLWDRGFRRFAFCGFQFEVGFEVAADGVDLLQQARGIPGWRRQCWSRLLIRDQ